MKILICSYEDQVVGKVDDEIAILKQHLEDVEVVVKPYESEDQLVKDLKEVKGLLSVFIPIGQSVLEAAKSLEVISLSSTGYSNVDIEAAKQAGIKVCHIKEYCTAEVADHCMALMLSLCRKLPVYGEMVNKSNQWLYDGAGSIRRLSDHVLGIYGLGRIGQALALRAKAFGMKVVAVDPYLPKSLADEVGVELVDTRYIQENATIISNHMNATGINADYFDMEYFINLKKKPIFINVSRGDSVDEDALLEALDLGMIESIALDVFKAEEPDLSSSKFINRTDVIITPHAAFYSEGSMGDLKKISSMNLVYHFTDQSPKVFAYL